jgi:hypothetical protein
VSGLAPDPAGLPEEPEEDRALGDPEPEPPRRRLSPGTLLRGTIAWLSVAVLLAVVPFFILVRVAVAAWQGGAGAWGAAALGVVSVYLVLAAWSWLMGRRSRPGGGTRRLLDRGAVALGVAFVLYGLVWIGASNAPDPEVRAEYRALHPVLRLATGLVFLADPGRVITEEGRSMEDYRLLGLSAAEASRHDVQDDGFVHAVDFRTRGRPEWGNRGVDLGFWLLGFHTRRHRGIADHLHVSLRPGR